MKFYCLFVKKVVVKYQKQMEMAGFESGRDNRILLHGEKFAIATSHFIISVVC